MFNFNLHILGWSLIIFFALMLQVLVGTIRTITMIKGNKTLTSVIGFIEATIAITVSITVISNAVKEGINLFIILFYATGFAAGLFIGMTVSNKLTKDMVSVNIITRCPESDIENKIREFGFGVTSQNGSGKDGDLKVLNIICKKSNLEKLKLIAHQIDPKSMVTSHTLEGLTGGFIYDIRK